MIFPEHGLWLKANQEKIFLVLQIVINKKWRILGATIDLRQPLTNYFPAQS